MISPEDFDYELPNELIAQEPAVPRDSCKLLIYDRKTGRITHTVFREIGDLLDKNEMLVVNRSKVIPARLLGVKASGGKAEVLLLKKRDAFRWEAMTKNLKVGQVMMVGKWQVKVVAEGEVELDFDEKIIDEVGKMPLPPYIKSQGWEKEYQTVYARERGSSAAPTAGLHFTPELLGKIKDKGVRIEEVVLHVGLGTFAKVTAENIAKKELHHEHFEVEDGVWQRLHEAKEQGRRIIAVGTTSLRVLETGRQRGETSIFIYPPYQFKMVDSLLTNFHLPKSSLLMLVAALVGEEWRRIYREAVERKYRFFSFGDAMWVI